MDAPLRRQIRSDQAFNHVEDFEPRASPSDFWASASWPLAVFRAGRRKKQNKKTKQNQLVEPRLLSTGQVLMEHPGKSEDEYFSPGQMAVAQNSPAGFAQVLVFVGSLDTRPPDFAGSPR